MLGVDVNLCISVSTSEIPSVVMRAGVGCSQGTNAQENGPKCGQRRTKGQE